MNIGMTARSTRSMTAPRLAALAGLLEIADTSKGPRKRGKGQSERVRNQQTPEGVAADTGDGGVAAGNF